MDDQPLKTMKEVADDFKRPAHRIIHLCETDLIRPAVDAEGRGSVRRFCRDDTFRIIIALKMQEVGLQVPLIKYVMEALDGLMRRDEVRKLRGRMTVGDLVEVIQKISSPNEPALAFVPHRGEVILVTPGLAISGQSVLDVVLKPTAQPLLTDEAISIVVNLTLHAELIKKIWSRKS